MKEMTGRCLCGSVQWKTESGILWAGHCHCDSCRRVTGAPFTSFFGVDRNSVEWNGQMSEHTTSAGKVTRQFCTDCGTQMTYQNDAWPNETHLYAASLDDQTHFVPEAHYHYAEKLSWVQLEDDLPRFPGSADVSEPLP